MHTRGLIARPWRQDLTLGARETKEGLAVRHEVETKAYGKLVFDIPRHRIYMGFKHDWPRMNTLPEWFTVEPGKEYVVKNVASGSEKTYTGKQLHEGLPIELQAGEGDAVVGRTLDPAAFGPGTRRFTNDPNV